MLKFYAAPLLLLLNYVLTLTNLWWLLIGRLRTVCHGISASAGKLGALIASILFTFAKTDKALFLISGYTSFAAAIFTFLTIPDLTTLDLYEIDRHWRMILNGAEYEYDGLAVDPKHLSYLERRKNRSAVM